MKDLNHHVFTSALETCLTPSAAPRSLPPAAYTSQDAAALEQDAIFRTSWLSVGRADVVKNAGDFVTLDIAGQSVILVRDREGQIRAFANSCRHRGARLMEGDGNCRGIKCPFHAWAYRLDGTLAAAPHMQDVPGFQREGNGLIPYRAEERMGFAFICLNPDAPELDEVLGDFSEIHAPWPFETLVTTRRREFTVDCNWKSFLEVFNEYYHLPFVHPTTVDGVYNRPEPADQTRGAFASQFGLTEGTGGLLQTQQEMALPPIPDLPDHAAAGVRYTWVFPNMTFAAGKDALWVYEAYPMGPGKCHVVQSACFPPETLALSDVADRLTAYHERLDAAIAEDIPALENQQRGLSCPDAMQGSIQPLLESNLATFSHWYAEKMMQI